MRKNYLRRMSINARFEPDRCVEIRLAGAADRTIFPVARNKGDFHHTLEGCKSG